MYIVMLRAGGVGCGRATGRQDGARLIFVMSIGSASFPPFRPFYLFILLIFFSLSLFSTSKCILWATCCSHRFSTSLFLLSSSSFFFFHLLPHFSFSSYSVSESLQKNCRQTTGYARVFLERTKAPREGPSRVFISSCL